MFCLTARSDFETKELLLQAFRNTGIEIDLPGLYVERAENMTDATDKNAVARRKKKTVLDCMSDGQL